jgi:hypothetical protein
VATLMEVVALNALSVNRWVRGVDRVDPRSCKSEIFQGRGFPSSVPHMSQNTVEGTLSIHARGPDRCTRVGEALTRSLLEGFQGADSSGVYSS